MKKRQVIIKKLVKQAGLFLSIEYVRDFKDYTPLCMAVINDLLDEKQEISISQFYDESQDLLSNSLGLYQQLQKLYGYEAKSTKEMDSPELSDENDQKYVIHFEGAYDRLALKRLIRFGGESLPFVIYGINQYTENWFEELIERNHLFVKWFWMKTDQNAAFTLLAKVNIVLFASDDWLCMIIPNHRAWKALEIIKKQCMLFEVDFTEVTKM